MRVYRCIRASLWDYPDPWSHVPLLDVAPKAGRWNPDGQWALYTSHEPDVAIEEKRRHLVDPRPRSVFGSIAAAVGEPLATQIVVFEMSAPGTTPAQVFDGRKYPRELFDPMLGRDDYARSNRLAAEQIRLGVRGMIVPSSPCPVSWNSVFFCFGGGQFELRDLPLKAACRAVMRRAVEPS